MKYDLSKNGEVIKFGLRAKQLEAAGAFVELRKITPIRSNQQNRYLHLLISYFATEYGETAEYTKKKFFKLEANKELFLTEYVNEKTGEVRAELRTTATLSKAELTEAIERFRNYASKEAGIYLPEAGEEDFLRQCEIDIENSKSLL